MILSLTEESMQLPKFTLCLTQRSEGDSIPDRESMHLSKFTLCLTQRSEDNSIPDREKHAFIEIHFVPNTQRSELFS